MISFPQDHRWYHFRKTIPEMMKSLPNIQPQKNTVTSLMDALDRNPRVKWPVVIEMALEAAKAQGYSEGRSMKENGSDKQRGTQGENLSAADQ